MLKLEVKRRSRVFFPHVGKLINCLRESVLIKSLNMVLEGDESESLTLKSPTKMMSLLGSIKLPNKFRILVRTFLLFAVIGGM